MWPDHKESRWNFLYISIYVYAQARKMGPQRLKENGHEQSILIVQLKKELCGRRNVKLPVKRLASRPRPATNQLCNFV